MYSIITLDYLIIVGVRLLIFRQFSSHYALIPYPTFINFGRNVHPIWLFHPLFIECMKHPHNMLPNRLKFGLYFKFKGVNLTYNYQILGNFPPNMPVPSPMIIKFLQISTQYDYSIPYIF